MIFKTIRARMLAAALVPVTLVVVVLVAGFWVNRVGDLGESHRVRAKLLVRQVSMASEYGLFSNNVASLQGVVNTVYKEADVHSVAVYNASGVVVARVGELAFEHLDDRPAGSAQLVVRGRDVFMEPVRASKVFLEDLFAQPGGDSATPAMVLGYAVVELSRDGLSARERDLLWIALWVGLVGLLVGGVLATQMGNGAVSMSHNLLTILLMFQEPLLQEPGILVMEAR